MRDQKAWDRRKQPASARAFLGQPHGAIDDAITGKHAQQFGGAAG
jgi:hypothetical protein